MFRRANNREDTPMSRGHNVAVLAIVLCSATAGVCIAADAPAGAERVAAILASAPLAELVDIDAVDIAIEPAQVAAVRAIVWNAYVQQATKDPVRCAEIKAQQITLAGATMRFASVTRGAKPEAGYPLYIALHGGGGAPARLNDSQWRHMGVYYRDSVKCGVYVAARGVSDTWNLHFRPESYPCYDRLIEDMILFAQIDPNRVYLLGYSAGGDGVYQIACRMPDRWAAASMSAGHHNGVRPMNLLHVPLLLQVGARDTAYDRNKATVEYALQLDALRTKHPNGYVHELFVHADKPHNFRDNDPRETPQKVIADPAAWLRSGADASEARNTNAIAWLRRHRRAPLPARIIWDLKTDADRSASTRGRQCYWLDIGDRDPSGLGADQIRATFDKSQQRFRVDQVGSYLRILLSDRMLDLSQLLTLEHHGTVVTGRPQPNLKTMLRTLLERGDPNYIFAAECTLECSNGAWRVAGLGTAD
jgi:hypothetical protein